VLHLVEHSEQQSVDAVYCDVTMRFRHDEVDTVRLTVLVLVLVLVVDLDLGMILGSGFSGGSGDFRFRGCTGV
jgi:hypothetical protein